MLMRKEIEVKEKKKKKTKEIPRFGVFGCTVEVWRSGRNRRSADSERLLSTLSSSGLFVLY